MSIICPECNKLGQAVSDITVENLVLEDDIRAGGAGEESFYLCREPGCSVVYFNEERAYGIPALKVPVWFKEGSGEGSPICYCAGITRKDIREAVASGKKTSSEIRNHTGKTERGNCLRENPAGRCCDQEFDEEIIKYRRLLR